MPLTAQIIKRLEVPHEPGAWIEIRMLSWLRLDEARRKRIDAIANSSRSISGPELQELVKAAREAAKEKAVGQPPDRLVNYDMVTLFRGGIMAWSYGDYSPELAEELDEKTAGWLAHEILDLALPTETHTKNDLSLSTAT